MVLGGWEHLHTPKSLLNFGVIWGHSGSISLLVLLGSSKVILGSSGAILALIVVWTLNLVGVVIIQRGFLYWYTRGHLRSSWGHLSVNGCMDLKLGGCSDHSERIFLLVHPGVIWGHLGVIWGHVSIKGHLDVKLGECSHSSEQGFIKVLLGSSEVILGSSEVICDPLPQNPEHVGNVTFWDLYIVGKSRLSALIWHLICFCSIYTFKVKIYTSLSVNSCN